MFINISCYCFAELSDLKSLKTQLVDACKGRQLKGTILLSTEGINLFIAGSRQSVDEVVSMIRAVPGLEKLAPKYSESDHQPFNRMLVRIKKEIISFGVEGVNPAKRTSPKLSARELKQWLDEGKPVTLLDTRNDYEIKLGTFEGAIPAGIRNFRQFPEAVRKLPPEMKDQPIVMFCTGGIRCEKAGPFMEMEGFQHIYQLDGGILKYFEEVGGDHYQGECFVFDQRVGVDPALQESDSKQCFACLAPLTPEDQEDFRYQPPQSCPYCYKEPHELLAERLSQRHQKLAQVTKVLPGSIPYENRRPMQVPERFDGATLLDFISGILKHLSREGWAEICKRGLIQNTEGQPVSPDQVVRFRERYYHVQPHLVEPEVDSRIRFVYEDDALVVISKPAPLPVHPCGRFNRNTLEYILDLVYPMQKLRAAHRIDANTTGLLVLTRVRRYASVLQPQFGRGEVEKKYLVKVIGTPSEDFFTVDLPISVEPGETGSRKADLDHGLPAKTEFRVLERFSDQTTLLEATPLTGRTNQIRVHLWEVGFPVCGDTVYLPGKKIGLVQTRGLIDPLLCLHSWKITLNHPQTRERVSFEDERPNWAKSG